MGALWGRLGLRNADDSAAAASAVERPTRPVRDTGCRRRTEVRGRVLETTLRPTSGGAECFVALLETDDGPVELVWLGRRRLAGVGDGTALRATGLLTQARGRRTIYNPSYALEPVLEELS